jgi:hypothetical protein
MAVLELSRARATRAAKEREALLRLCAERAGDAAAQEELVEEVGRVQRCYAAGNAACLLALYGSVFTAQQLAAFAVGSW